MKEQFSAGVPQEFLKHAVPGNLVGGPDLFSLRLSNQKMTTANTTIVISVSESKSYLFILSGWQKIYLLVCRRIFVISLCVMQFEKVENR